MAPETGLPWRKTLAMNGRYVRAQINRAGLVLAAVAGLTATGLPATPVMANGVGTIFVANEGSSTVSVLEHVGQTVLVTVPVGPAPRSVAITPDGRTAFVANRGNGTVSAIDRDYYQVSMTTRVGKAPEAVVAPLDTTNSLVAEGPGNEIVTIDASGSRVKSVQVQGKPIALVSDRAARKSYVAVEGGTKLFVIDDGDRVSGMIEMKEPAVALALSADGAVLYAVTPESNSLAIINVSAGQVVTNVPVGLTPLGLTVTPDGRVLVANSISNDVTVVDPVARTAIAQVAVGKRPVALAIGPDGAFAYVANNDSNTVSIIDLGRLEQVKSVPVGQKPVAVAVAPVQMVASTRPPGSASVADNARPPASSAIIGGATDATARGAAASGPSVLPKTLPNTGDGSMAATGPSASDVVPYAGAGMAVGAIVAFMRRRLVRIPVRG